VEKIEYGAPEFVPRVASHIDDRGIFSRLVESPIDFPSEQINISISSQKGTFRGLHLLRGEHSEFKKITVIKGQILDFIVNVDLNSNQYGKTYEFNIDEKSDAIIIPPFHAHGFLTISGFSL
jgi:dTDP-4-dehydrorhamnose 3,5-epimerase